MKTINDKLKGLIIAQSIEGDNTIIYKDGKLIAANEIISAQDLLDLLDLPYTLIMYNPEVNYPDKYKNEQDLREQLKTDLEEEDDDNN